MKKFSIVFAAILLVVSAGMAQAALEWEDPALCIEGQWLVIDAAHISAIKVVVPEGTHYGSQAAGGCTTPAPAPLLPLTVVNGRGHGDNLTVNIDGASASPVVKVRYGADQKSRVNHGEEMKFKFRMDD